MQPVRDRNTENSKFDSGQTKNSNQDNIFIKLGNDKTDAGCFCRKMTFQKSQDYNVFKVQLLDNLLRAGKKKSNHVQQLLVFQNAHILMIIARAQLALSLSKRQKSTKSIWRH